MPYDASNDPYANYVAGTSGRRLTPITPSDTEDLSPYPKHVVVIGGAGESPGQNVVVLPLGNDDDAPITFAAVTPGMVIPVRVRRVLATGTTTSVAAMDD